VTGVELEEASEAGREQQLVLLFGSKTQDFKLVFSSSVQLDLFLISALWLPFSEASNPGFHL